MSSSDENTASENKTFSPLISFTGILIVSFLSVICVFFIFLDDINFSKELFVQSYNPTYYFSDLKKIAIAIIVLSFFAIVALFGPIITSKILIIFISFGLSFLFGLGTIILESIFYTTTWKSLLPLNYQNRQSQKIQDYIIQSIGILYEQGRANLFKYYPNDQNVLKLLDWSTAQNSIGQKVENYSVNHQYTSFWKGINPTSPLTIPNTIALSIDSTVNPKGNLDIFYIDAYPVGNPSLKIPVASLNFNSTDGYKSSRSFCWAIDNRNSYKCQSYSNSNQPNQHLYIDKNSMINGEFKDTRNISELANYNIYNIQEFPIGFYLLSYDEINTQRNIANLPDEGLSRQAFFYDQFNNYYSLLSSKSFIKEYGKKEEKKTDQIYWCHMKPDSFQDAYTYISGAFNGFPTDLDLTTSAKCSNVSHYLSVSVLDSSAPFINVGNYPKWYEKNLASEAKFEIFHPEDVEISLAQFAIISVIIQGGGLLGLLIVNILILLSICKGDDKNNGRRQSLSAESSLLTSLFGENDKQYQPMNEDQNQPESNEQVNKDEHPKETEIKGTEVFENPGFDDNGDKVNDD